MTNQDLDILKANIDKVVRIKFLNGETSLVKVRFVSDDERDLIYDLISTDKESTYEKLDEQPAYRASFDEIDKVESDKDSIKN